jgi:hypothetical protein
MQDAAAVLDRRRLRRLVPDRRGALRPQQLPNPNLQVQLI